MRTNNVQDKDMVTDNTNQVGFLCFRGGGGGSFSFSVEIFFSTYSNYAIYSFAEKSKKKPLTGTAILKTQRAHLADTTSPSRIVRIVFLMVFFHRGIIPMTINVFYSFHCKILRREGVEMVVNHQGHGKYCSVNGDVSRQGRIRR